MSTVATTQRSSGVRLIGLLTIIAGAIMIVAGGVTWGAVAQQLADERIYVADDAAFAAGQLVNNPVAAFAQADIINQHALNSSGGLTYAELDREDPVRATMMNASFLRASLFTSVVAFGVAALVIGLGVLFILTGWSLRRLAAGVAVPAAVAAAPAAAVDPPVASSSTS